MGSVKTAEGEISCATLEGLAPGSNVVVVVRPESLNLHQQRPANMANVIEAKIGAAMFLGEYLDCTVELRGNVLQTHQRHTLQVRRGDPVWVELPAAECMALPAE
jgi:ABC-type Fe3+/spermidine/putrescine transport system ATPase subunit